jgi:glycosyltransferase involved in cell wall biosynthesis
MSKPKITIGMPCHDDFEGVYFSVQALSLYHAEVMACAEILVIDNDPDDDQGRQTKDFITSWVRNGRYVPFTDKIGAAAAKNRIFEEARAEIVLCMDAHVLLAPSSLPRLLRFFETDAHTEDLFQGPLLLDNLADVATHMEPVWRGEMFGIWGTDLSLVQGTPNFEQPEIGMHGMGLFSSRRETWLGFHPEFTGFGGEEGYIHQKYRNAGRKTRLLPFLKWVHRFNRTHPIRFPCTRYHKIRNYLIGWDEVNLPLRDVIEHFKPVTPRQELEAAVRDSGIDLNKLL